MYIYICIINLSRAKQKYNIKRVNVRVFCTEVEEIIFKFHLPVVFSVKKKRRKKRVCGVSMSWIHTKTELPLSVIRSLVLLRGGA